MPTPSKVEQLPPEVRAWLDQHLVEGNFSGYEALAAELEARGCEISKSSLHRYGKAFQDRLKRIKLSTERAQAMRDYLGDDEGAVTDSLIRQAQWLLEESLAELDPKEVDQKGLATVAKAIAELSRASVTSKKYMREVRQAAAQAAEEVAEVATAGGLSDESVQLLRKKILGIPDVK